MDLAQELIERAKKPGITTPDLAQELIEKSRRAKYKVKYPEAGEFLKPEMKPAYVSTTRIEDMPEQKVEPVAPKGPDIAEPAMRMVAWPITFPIRFLQDAYNVVSLAPTVKLALQTGQKVVEVEDKTKPLPLGGYAKEYKHVAMTEDEINELQQKFKQKQIALGTDIAIAVGGRVAMKLLRPILQKIRVALFSRKVSDKDLWRIMQKVTKLKGNVGGLTEFEREIWLTADQVAKNSGFRGISNMYAKMVKTGAKLKWIPKGKVGEGYWTIAGYEAPKPIYPAWHTKPVKPEAIVGKELNATELINAEAKQMVKRGLIFTGPKDDAMVIALEKQIIPEVVNKKDIALFIKEFGGKDGYLRQLINSGGPIYDITQRLKGAFYKEYGEPIVLGGEVSPEVKPAPEVKPTPGIKPIEKPEAKLELRGEATKIPKTIKYEKLGGISLFKHLKEKYPPDDIYLQAISDKFGKSADWESEEYALFRKYKLFTNNPHARTPDEVATDMGIDEEALRTKINDIIYDYQASGKIEVVQGRHLINNLEREILTEYSKAINMMETAKGTDLAKAIKAFEKAEAKAKDITKKYPLIIEDMGLSKEQALAVSKREAATDFLTGTLNHRQLDKDFPVYSEAKKNLVVFDGIKFGRFNEEPYNKAIGDKVMGLHGKVFADYMVANPSARIYRQGGDQFMMFTDDIVGDGELHDLNRKLGEEAAKTIPELKKGDYPMLRWQQGKIISGEDKGDAIGRISQNMEENWEKGNTVVVSPEAGVEDPWQRGEEDFVPVAKKKQAMIPGTEKREFPKEMIRPETPEEIARAKAAQEKPMPLLETAGEKGAEQLRLGSQKPPQTTADIGGYTVSPSGKLALPEIVECASNLMEGKYPYIVEHLRAGGGMATGVFGTKRGEIKLKASIFANLEEAEKTLAHEIGHLVDWLPDRDIKRGNILGRIATLKKYMKGTYESLATNKDIRTELKTLSQAWKPFNETDDKMVKYRYSSRELYADAISVLFNDPKLLEETAPLFYKGFFDYLERKPQVQQIYNEILEVIESEETLLAHRQARMRGMYGKGEEIFAQKRLERKNKTIIGVLRHWFYDRNIAATEYIEKAMRQGLEIKPEDNPVYWIEEMVYSTAEGESYMRSMDGVHKTLKKNGLSWEDLGDVLYHERVIVERATLANPLGFNPETSTRQLTYIQEKLGPEKWQILQNAVKDFRKVREYVIGRIEEGHFVGSDLLKRMKEQPEYAHFLVLRHYQNKFGTDLSGWIMPQTGTLGEVANPATGTVMKDMAILKDINRAQAAHKLIQLIKQVAPEEIAVPERRFNGKFLAPIKPKDPNWKLIVYPLDGELQAHYVRPRVAEIFNHSYGTIDQIGKVLSIGNKIFKELYVGINYGFMGFNLCRDFVRLVKTMPGNPFAVVYEYLKAIPSAVRRGWGMDDATINEMLKKKMLITFGGRYTVVSTEDKQIEALLRKYEIMGPEKYRSVILWPFHKLFIGLHNLGQTIEMIPKVSGYRHLTKLGFNEKEVGHRIRTMAGSPDFLRKGRTSGLYNNIALFSNPMIQGWAGDIEATKLDPMGYTAKTIVANVVPKLLMYLGSIGALGLGIKKIYDRASEYDKANYTIIPLGLTENDKAVYLRVPQDEVGRFLGGVLWKAMTTRRASDIAQLADYTAGQVPSLAPALTMGVDIAQYCVGRNPYDAFRGRYVLDKTVFEAGGWRSHKEFLKYLAKQGGINIVYRFGSDRDIQVKSELEKVLAYPILSNILGRFVKVSDYGVREQITEALQPVRQKRAEEIVLSRDAIRKIIRNERPTEKELVALSKHPNIKERNLQILLAKRFGPAYLDMLLEAKNDEEKMVVWQTIMKLEPAEKKQIEKVLQPQL